MLPSRPRVLAGAISKMNWYLAACFHKFHELEKQKLIEKKQLDWPSYVGSWLLSKKEVLYFNPFMKEADII